MNSGDRKEQKAPQACDPAEPRTSRYAVGLAIPRPVARLQSRSLLHQAQEYNSWVRTGQNTQRALEERRLRRVEDWTGRPWTSRGGLVAPVFDKGRPGSPGR